MKVSVVGTGYVGLVSGTCFAEMGHHVTCIDVDENKIKMLWEGKSPIYEPGLSEMLTRNIQSKRLFFSIDYTSVKNSKVIFLAVGTPSASNGEADLSYLFDAAKEVALLLSDRSIVVIKSTVPVGTAAKIKKHIAQFTKVKFFVVNNPEFLKEGSAIDDFMRPDRVVIGYSQENNGEEGKIMEELYAPLVRQGNPIYHMSNISAEMTKYAANSFLATKISFINEVARLCDVTGADIEEVRKGITSDRRIGHFFLYPGPGYGGSCFPKDVRALLSTAKEHGINLKIVQAANDVNNEQKHYTFKKILKHFNGNIKGKVFTLWGVSFKPNTDDIREAPSITLTNEILNAGGSVNFYDPVASTHFYEYINNNLSDAIRRLRMFENKYDAINDADALVVLTDWAEFKAPDFMEMKMRLKSAILFDSRNLYPTNRLLEMGFSYYAVGKYIPKSDVNLNFMDGNSTTVQEFNKQILEGEIGVGVNNESSDQNWVNSTQL
ncbi:MAG: UDP-glucose/GDP-mannose dehydrogenase family protein [Oligoflexia bacterium]|nr:UDP-glucose/GDP-mannose dehydrogenase family protein [Oligoflexia bacterium]